MSHFADDVHHRVSTRISEVIPDFVESEYPAFVSFVQAYYEFLEQHDTLPTTSTFVEQTGVVSVQAGSSTIIGANTHFTLGGYHNSTQLLTEGIEPYIVQLEDGDGQLLDESSSIATYSNNIQLRVGSDEFRIRSVTSNTELVIYQVPVRSYFANTHFIEKNKSIRQAAGAARQIATIHEVDHTLDDFISYFRDTYLRDIPQGLTDAKTLLPRILDFYQSKGSETSYQFLFQALYGKEVMFSYPRESVFTTSDNEYITPTLLRIGYATEAAVTGNVALLETREIIGLTSNARATVSRSIIAYEGDRRVVRAFITEPLISQELSGLLLEDGMQLLATKYGIPPDGLASDVYTYTFIQERVSATNFVAGETFSTVPTNDPKAITGELLGSITGFTIDTRGGGYQINDLVYPPSRYANGTVFTGGFGGVGRISAFTDVDITEINIDDAGLGYYAGLPLIVDNTGTGGGTGLSGYVTNVSPGNITLQADAGAGIANGDVLTFVYETDGLNYTASREKIDYYQLGVSLSDLFGGLVLDDASDSSNDGDDLLDEEDGATGDGQLLQQTAIVIGDSSWNTNSSSAIYAANLDTTIIGLTSNLSTFPVFVNGVRTEVGEVYHLTVESFGSGYVAGVPTLTIPTPVQPTSDSAGLVPLSYVEIFGENFDTAAVSVEKETGQIGQVDVVTGGSGYSNAAFSVNSTTSTTTTGNSAVLGLTLGAISRGVPYFKNTRSFASADQHLQDVTKYQPFSYVLTVEESLSRYSDILRRLVHPAGGLLIPRQTITTELDLTPSISFGGVDIIIEISEDLTIDPPSPFATIRLTAPAQTIGLAVPVATNTIELTAPAQTLHLVTLVATNTIEITAADETATAQMSAVTINVSAPAQTLHLVAPVETNTIEVAAAEETTSVVIPISNVAIDVSSPAQTLHLVTPVETNTVKLTAAEETTSVVIPISNAAIDTSAPAQTMHLVTPVPTNTIELTAAEETTHQTILVSAASVIVDAPTASRTAQIELSVTFDTYLTAYGDVVIAPSENELLSLYVRREANRTEVSAPTATII